MKCAACAKTFSEKIGTIFYNRKHKDETIIQVFQCLCEGNRLSEVERITKVTRKTISKWLEAASQHVDEVSDYLIKNLHITEVQLDEFGSFVKKKQNHLTDWEKLEAEYGDCWGHISFDPNTKMIPAHVFGKRNKEKLEQQFNLFLGYYHFCRPHGGLRVALDKPQNGRKFQYRTPAMAAGITDHIWDFKELFYFRVPRGT